MEGRKKGGSCEREKKGVSNQQLKSPKDNHRTFAAHLKEKIRDGL